VWDVEDQILERKYHGVVQGHFTIFSSFGGASDEYIASGSEGTFYTFYAEEVEQMPIGFDAAA